LQVKKGEIIGIIGKNGAGKSTLLKILSRITAPTSGVVKIQGRVASLLEVGTGFHAELTGRENIYLNGAILGMTRKEIDYRLEEIIDFSGIERYIETPVKRYSSGMRVRLAFSVAAHLDVDIMLVDEVLAVGDLEFQQKSINYLENKGKNTKTVLFVSHRLHHIEDLTQRTILFDKGRMIKDGKTDDVIEYYKDKVIKLDSNRKKSSNLEYNNQFKLTNFKFYNMNNEETNSFIKGQAFRTSFEIIISDITPLETSVSLIIEDVNGKQIISTEVGKVNFQKGTYKFEYFEDNIRYNWGDYFISIVIQSKDDLLVEYSQCARITFKNKYIKNEVSYGGYLLNQMEAQVKKID
jgi:lipopolysaccharide transport system ATP-binding protein